MGMAGTRFGRNVALDKAFPEPMPGLHGAQPAHDQPHADAARARSRPPPRSTCWPPPGSSSRPTTGSPTTASRTSGLEIQPARGHAWHENPMRIPRTPRRPHPRPSRQGPAADLHQPALALVGRLGHLRQLRRSSATRVRTFTDGKLVLQGRPAAARRRDRHGDHRVQRELVDRPRDAAHPLHPRAQRDLRRAEEGAPADDRRRAVRHRPARQLRAASPRSTRSSGRRRSSPTRR